MPQPELLDIVILRIVPSARSELPTGKLSAPSRLESNVCSRDSKRGDFITSATLCARVPVITGVRKSLCMLRAKRLDLKKCPE
jgi:hypothetical protein